MLVAISVKNEKLAENKRSIVNIHNSLLVLCMKMIIMNMIQSVYNMMFQ